MMADVKRCFAKMSQYSPPTGLREGMLRLDFNENTQGCSSRVVSALRKLSAEDISKYPDYAGAAQKVSGYVGFGVGEGNIMLTNGSDEAIKCVMDAYVGPCDEVIIPVPTFALFEVYARICTNEIVKVQYGEDMKFPKQEIISAISEKTKVIVIVNPNNPSGTAASKEDILDIVRASKNAVVLVDEAYFEYYGKTSVELACEYENVVVIRTFSKAFGLAGLRCGYVVSRGKNILNLLKVRSPYSVSRGACAGMAAALSDVEFVEDYVGEVKKSRGMLFLGLSRLGVKCYESFANFVLADFGACAGYVWSELARREGILTRKWDNEEMRGYIRIGAGTCAEAERVVDALEGIFCKNEAFVFDVDGVLIDISRSYRMAVKMTVEFFLGWQVCMEDIQEVKNMGGFNNDWDLCAKMIQDRGGDVSKEKIVDKFQEYYGKYKGNERWILSKDVILKLEGRYRLGICSGRPRDELVSALRCAGMDEYFSVVVGMEDADEQKPSPCGIIKVLEMLGCRRGYYAGDTCDDMIAAKRAGVTGVGVLPPQDKSSFLKKRLFRSGADFVVDDANKICEIEGVM